MNTAQLMKVNLIRMALVVLVGTLFSAIGLLVAVQSTHAQDQTAATTGQVWAWGSNEIGQLGDGTNTNRTTPVQVSDLSGVQAIAGGGAHSLVLKNDGT